MLPRRIFDAATKLNGTAFLREVVAALPYAVHTVLTDNGAPFAEQPRYRGGISDRLGGHPFDRVCRAHGIEHRLTRPYHPWTNGQAERMNRTVKDAYASGQLALNRRAEAARMVSTNANRWTPCQTPSRPVAGVTMQN